MVSSVRRSWSDPVLCGLMIAAALIASVKAFAPDYGTTATFRTTNLQVDNTATIGSAFVDQGQFTASNTLTIATWTTGQTLTDWNPPGLSTAYVISMEQSSGTTNIDGILAQPTGTEITLYNRETSVGAIVLQYETGTAGNQFVLPGAPAGGYPWTIQPGASIKIRYGGSNWQFVSSGTYAFPFLSSHFGSQLDGTTAIQQIRGLEQLDTSTGTQNDFTLFNSTTILEWAGASDATFTGMIGGGAGRIVIIMNTSNGHNLTLSNQNGGSSSQHQYLNTGLTDVTLVGSVTGVGSASSAIYIFDGTELIWHLIAYTTTTINAATTYTAPLTYGNINARNVINGPIVQQLTIPNTAYTLGELNQFFVNGVVPIFPNDLFQFVIKNSAVADTTAHSSHSGALAVEVTSTRSVGANDLTNTAFECTVTGGQVNECIHVLAGDIVIDGGGNLVQNSGFAFLAGTFAAVGGNFFAEGNGTNAIDISGAPTNEIRMRQAASLIDVQNAAPSSLTFYNSNDGVFRMILGANATPTGGDILSPNTPTSVSHGSLETGSTDWWGTVTGIGANTSVVLTYSSTFPARSRCVATPNSIAVAVETIVVTARSATSATFSCYSVAAAPILTNCDDFTYECSGQ